MALFFRKKSQVPPAKTFKLDPRNKPQMKADAGDAVRFKDHHGTIREGQVIGACLANACLTVRLGGGRPYDIMGADGTLFQEILEENILEVLQRGKKGEKAILELRGLARAAAE